MLHSFVNQNAHVYIKQ